MARRRKNNAAGGGLKLLINALEPEEIRIAIVQGAQLEEYYIERQSQGSTLGNIYKARITNIEKSIGAAFVDFGHSRQGFLHVSDLCMAAVGEDAKELLAGVQAAREVPHDEDVVEPGRTDGKSPPASKSKKGEKAVDGEDGAPTEQVESREEGESAADDADDAPEPPLDDDAEPDYCPDDVVGWAGESEHDDRGEGLADVRYAEDDGEDDEEPIEEPPEIHGPPVLGSQDDEDSEDDEDDEDEAESEAEDDEDDEDDDGVDLDGPRGKGDGEPSPKAESDVEPAEDASEEDQPAQSSRRGRRRGGRRRGRSRAGAASKENGDGSVALAEPEPEDAEEEKEDAGGAKGRRRGGRRRGRRGGRQREYREMPPIEQILRKGQEIVVQVIKDGIGTKGPTLTTYLSIPGRYIVLMPGMEKRGVSRKVTDSKERERLKDIVRQLDAPDGLGFIVRTAGSRCSREDLQRDLDYLLRLWQQMETRIREHDAPVLLYQENDLVIRTLRDLYDGQGEIVTDDEATAETAREFMSQIMPDSVSKVTTYQAEKPLFTHYGIEAELSRLLLNRIELKSGASLIMEQTEALVAIDVNSGRFKPEETKNIDDTAFLVNSEAAVEVARQLRLRDLGGVVVIDFIDMRNERHRKQLERLFKDELRRDRARIKVARFSPFGILELTRQRVRPSLKRTVHQKCPYCDGTGFIPSDETSCLTVIRKVRENLWRPGSVLVVTVRPEVAEAVLNTQKKLLVELEEAGHRQIFVRADHRLAYDDIEVRAMVALPDGLDHRRA